VSVSESLPQRYPFRLVEHARGERVVALLTVDGHWLRDTPALPPTLALEMMAQAAHLLLAADGGAPVFLAGIDGAELRAPLRAGDRLLATARRTGSFGPLTKVEASLERDGETVALANYLLAGGTRR